MDLYDIPKTAISGTEAPPTCRLNFVCEGQPIRRKVKKLKQLVSDRRSDLTASLWPSVRIIKLILNSESCKAALL